MTSRVKYEVTLKLDQTERRINLALTFLHISTAIVYRIEQRASREILFSLQGIYIFFISKDVHILLVRVGLNIIKYYYGI